MQNCVSKQNFLQIIVPRLKKVIRMEHNINHDADNHFALFRRVCDEIAEERSYLNKSKILRDFFKRGSTGNGFTGNKLLWVQMLLPSESQRVYNIQNNKMLTLFSSLFGTDQQKMALDLEQEGDISETLRKFFEMSKGVKPQAETVLYLTDIEEFLESLSKFKTNIRQTDLLLGICKQATSLDLKMITRLIKQDLRINAGARHILDAFGPLAYATFQSSRDLAAVVQQFGNMDTEIDENADSSIEENDSNGANSNVQVMTPIAPMLANACKSVEDAFKKSPSGLYSEVKYDGERVQIHKKGNVFKFFSRNLKPVMEHKIKRFKQFIPKAFPGGGDMILDSEIILVNTVTGELLPFGTLGAHKKKQFRAAEVCLFVFDCILYNGKDLTQLAFHKRREILEDNIKPIKNYVQLSESQFLKTKNELSIMTAKVLKANLEGVVLKTPEGKYQPGKRGWLKVKKDYLFNGKMADTADLVVLGAWFGSGKKGGMWSIFLMGCYDSKEKLWKTVTKVHSGLDDATNEKIHEELFKLMERANSNFIPSWLQCKKSLVPDYIAIDPNNMPVWEITGAEFTKSEAHTAAGISIRFPRITKIRSDKSAEQANDLAYLQKLYEASKKNVNVDLLLANCDAEQHSEVQLNVTGKVSPGNQTPVKNDNVGKRSPNKAPTPAPKRTKITPKQEKRVTIATFFKPLLDKVENNGAEAQNDLQKGDLFVNVKAYFLDAKHHENELIINGGKVVTNPKDADFVFYKTDMAPVDMHNLRLHYKRDCRHLSVAWLYDSLAENALLPYAPYALVLN